MRNVHSRVPNPADFISHPGDLFQPIYSASFSADGSIKLVESDRLDIKREINSHLPLTDMNYILSRLFAGDDSVLTTKVPMYGDFTSFPRTYVEMLDLVQKGEEAFNSLPLDVRAKFDNDRYKWFASIGSDSWFDAMGVSRETISSDASAVKPVVPVVKPDVIKEASVSE